MQSDCSQHARRLGALPGEKKGDLRPGPLATRGEPDAGRIVERVFPRRDRAFCSFELGGEIVNGGRHDRQAILAAVRRRLDREQTRQVAERGDRASLNGP